MQVSFTETKAILSEMDIVQVRQCVKEHAIKMRMTLVEQTKLITAASEIARNTMKYGGGGQFILEYVEEGLQKGIRLIFEDKGPGIADIEQALKDGFTTGKGMGLGLSGSKRLMSEFSIDSKPGEGTRITMIKWAY